MLSARSLLIATAFGLAFGLLLITTAHRDLRSVGALHASLSSTGVEAALRQRLNGDGLSYQWVRCVQMSGTFQGQKVSRCNVNFGDPHVEPYCAVLVGGTLVTDHENRRLDCGQRARRDELAGQGSTAPH